MRRIFLLTLLLGFGLISNQSKGQDATCTGVLGGYSVDLNFTSDYNGVTVSCAVAKDGAAELTVNGGVGPFEYLWDTDDGQTTQSVTNLAKQTGLNILIRDAGNGGEICLMQNVNVSGPSKFTIVPSFSTFADVSCPGSSDGAVIPVVIGGTTDYDYKWNTGATTSSLTGLDAGNYSLTVTDLNGCTTDTTVTISETDPIVPGAVSTPITCEGDDDATITVSASGGTPGYTYAWSHDALLTSSVATALPDGSYTISVTDNSGASCQETQTVVIAAVDGIDPVPGGSDVTCGGADDGTASVTPDGGTPQYDIIWSTGSTDFQITGLAGGTYDVTVSDAGGCSATASIVVDEDPTITSGITSTDITCNGSDDGTATVVPAGGSGGALTQVWTSGGTGTTDAGLSAGRVYVTITEALTSCSIVDSADISEPDAVTATVSTTPITCPGDVDGTATVAPGGGDGSYSFLWNTGETTQSINSLTSGNYAVTVTDGNGVATTSNGCRATDDDDIAVPGSYSISTSTTNVTCGGGVDNGTATVTVTGGSGSFDILWDDPSSQTTTTATSLAPGIYNVTATDQGTGCELTTTANVATDPAITIDSYFVRENCAGGDDDGQGAVKASGGASPYVFDVTPASADMVVSFTSVDSIFIDGLGAQTYTIEVTDDDGCVGFGSIDMTEPASALSLSTSTVSDITCFGETDGEITAVATGGTADYSYEWEHDGSTNPALSGLTAGTYRVTVTDDNNCTDTSSFEIVEPDELTLSVDSTDILCNGDGNGTVTATAGGGTTPYTYIWNNSATTSVQTGLGQGSYAVTLTDGGNCQLTGSTQVNEPSAFTLTTSSTDESCFGEGDGTGTVLPSGGTGPTYDVAWDAGTGSQTSLIAVNLSAGRYYVTVTDQAGCTEADSIDVDTPADVQGTTSKTDVSCFGQSTGAAEITMTSGQSPFTYLWSNGATTSAISAVSAGTYGITATDNISCDFTASVTITEPSSVTVTTDSTDVTCNGADDGTATVNITGATGPTYLWDAGANNQTTQTATGLDGGTYNVTISYNGAACEYDTLVEVVEPDPLDDNPSEVQPDCGTANGELHVTPTGGSGNYSYAWSSSCSDETTGSCTGINGGEYSITITDTDNGCEFTADYELSSVGNMGASFITSEVTCNGGSDGELTVVPFNGVAPYVYNWRRTTDVRDMTTQTITGLQAGDYRVRITDDVLCVKFRRQIVTEPDELVVDVTTSDATCSGADDGSASAAVSGGTGDYDYAWSTGSALASIGSLAPATYQLTVTDENGCENSQDVVVDAQTAVLPNAVSNDPDCFGGSDASITLAPSGGSGSGYTYVWSNASTAQNLSSIGSGSYTVTVSDDVNCKGTETVVINDPAQINDNENITDATCGGTDGAITVSPSGGSGGYSYSWDTGESTSALSALAGGTKSLTITDGDGCAESFTLVVATSNGPSISTSGSNISCFGLEDGTGSVTVGSGNGPFEYLWTPTGATGTSISDLSAGTYYVQVTDDNDCISMDSVVVTDADEIQVNFTATEATCNGSADGALLAVPSDGIPPYGYAWSTGQTSQFIDGLVAATYDLTVTDGEGCSTKVSAVVSQSNALSVNVGSTAMTCYESDDATATANVSGGTASYEYEWSTGSDAKTISALSDGTYSVTVTDANSCTATGSVVIDPVDPMDPNATFDLPSCGGSGRCDGRIKTSVTGGVGDIDFLWSHGRTQGPNSGFQMCAGTHWLELTDDNGCTQHFDFELSSDGAPTATVTPTDIVCNGDDNGAALVVAAGGTPPYNYLWSPGGQTTSVLTGLSAGSYDVLVQDADTCTVTEEVTITEPDEILANLSKTNVTCGGNPDGTATVAPTGGSVALGYLWSNGESSADASHTISGLTAGTYRVTVADALSCQIIDSVTITSPSPFTLSTSSVDINCFGFDDGVAIASLSGGTTPYATIQWTRESDGGVQGTTKTITGLGEDKYYFDGEDANGCTVRDSVSLIEPTELTAVYDSTDNTCHGDFEGAAVATPSGGTLPYAYDWSPSGDVDSSITGLAAGTHTVEITDDRGCQLERTFTIEQPTPVIVDDISQSESTCLAADAQVTITLSGGAGSYTYLWPASAGSQTTQTATNLSAGTYNVTVADASSCDTVLTITVQDDAPYTVDLDSTDVSCGGSNDGEVNAVVTGGTLPIGYLWSDGATDATNSGIGAGVYDLTVVDGAGCLTFHSIEVNDGNTINISTGTDMVTCNGGADGTGTVTPTNGVSPYTFTWSDVGDTDSLRTDLTAGRYYITVTDGAGCSAVDSIDVDQAGVLFASASVAKNVTCNGLQQGQAIGAGLGGQTPYQGLIWSNGSTDATISNLAAGSYTVTVTDSLGCTATDAATISEPDAYSVTVTTTDAACAATDGTAEVTVAGGTQYTVGDPYTYAWDAGTTNQTTALASNLGAGTYQITITDSLSCDTVITGIDVSNPSAPVITIDGFQDETCFEAGDGFINITATGTGTLDYSWTSTGGYTSTDEDITDLSEDTYTVEVTDEDGCTQVESQVIGAPTEVDTTSVTINHATCGDANGDIVVVATGGVGGYTYAWNALASTDATVNDVAAFAYRVTITDSDDCSNTFDATVTNSDGPDGSVSSTDATCFNVFDGTATVNLTQGTAPFTYAWSPGGQTTSVATALEQGDYDVVVTDANDCSNTLSGTVDSPDEITASFVTESPTCGNADGQIEITAAGGTPFGVGEPYLYQWDANAGSSTNDTVQGLLPNTYNVTVTDQICTETFARSISNLDGPSIDGVNQTDNICHNGTAGALDITVSGDHVPFDFAWDNGAITEDVSGLAAGDYQVVVTDTNDCVSIANYTIAEPDSIEISFLTTSETCGDANGEITVSATGGTGDLSYQWGPNAGGSISQTISDLSSALTYNVTVTDDNLCTNTDSETFPNIPGPTDVTFGITDVNCFGQATGELMATAVGGTAAYEYAWSNAETTQTVEDLVAGRYYITLTDDNGCLHLDSADVAENDQIDISSSLTTPLCGETNGAIDLTVSGGTPGVAPEYTFVWNTGDLTEDISSKGAGTYNVTVTDDLSCTETASIGLSNADGPEIVLDSVRSISCTGEADGAIYTTVSGDNGPFELLWTGGGVNDDTVGVAAGTYRLTVTDANDCAAFRDTTLTDPDPLNGSLVTTASTCGDANGTITANITGGTGAYTYAWDNGASTSALSAMAAGAYTVTVTDENGCFDQYTESINNTGGPTDILFTTSDALCFDQADGSIQATAVGGTSPYDYLWDAGASNSTTQTVAGLIQGSYEVTITDDNGCSISEVGVLGSPDAITIVSTEDEPECGVSDGSIAVTPSGGAGTDYTYLWNDASAQTGATATGLPAGSFTVTITDNSVQACNATFDFGLSNSDGPAVTLEEQINVLCNGGSSGSIDISATGDNSPFTYAWSNAESTQDVSSLSTAVYTVTVEDTEGCLAIESYDVTEPDAIGLDFVTADGTCGDDNGTATATMTGGTGDASFLWDVNAGSQIAATATGLAANTYSVTVTDDNLCTYDETIAVGNIDGPSGVIFTSTDVDCFGQATGTLTANANGGTADFTYAWATGESTQALSDLVAGDYTVTITDANNCTTSSTETILENDQIAISEDINTALCGQSDGDIDLTVAGGTPGVAPEYTFLWSNAEVTEDLTDVSAGTYTVSVTDALSCTEVKVIGLSNTDGPTITVDVVSDVECFSGNDGAIETTVTGEEPIDLVWTNAAITDDISSLVAGTYMLTATDKNGCIALRDTVVEEPDVLSATFDEQGSTCGDNNGQLTANISGGTGDYTYLWNTGANTSVLSVVPAGTYTVSVTDENGCQASFTEDINNTDGPTDIDFTTTDALCYDQADGSIQASPVGGESPYEYLWDAAADNATTQIATGLIQGNYTVTVTDDNGCTVSATGVVGSPDEIVITSTEDEPECGVADGSIAIVASGGAGTSFTYLWSDASAQTTPTATGLPAGSFNVTVTDNSAQACNASFNFGLSNSDGPEVAFNVVRSVTCFGDSDGVIAITTTGDNGPFTHTWSNGSNDEDISDLDPGDYFLTVEDTENCLTLEDTTIAEPDEITVSFAGVSETCGDGDGSIVATGAGGTGTHFYAWNTGANVASISNLSAGTFTVTVTDLNGCSGQDDTTITNIDGPTDIDFSITETTCFDGNNGAIGTAVEGGTSPYDYDWSTGATGLSGLTELSPGVYDVTVTDANGCELTQDTIVGSPDQITIIETVTEPTCENNDGIISLSTLGGTPVYTYTWEHNAGLDAPTATALFAGTYDLTITDDADCFETFQIPLSNIIGADVTITSVDSANCYQSEDGAIAIDVSGTNSPFDITWSNGSNDEDQTALAAGTYFVTVEDAINCLTIRDTIVDEPDSLQINFTITNTVCSADNGRLDATTTGGTGTVSYLWETAATDSFIVDLAVGNHALTVTDANGCETRDDADVVDQAGPTAANFSSTDASCAENEDGTATVSATGGTSPMSYLWSTAATDANISDLAPGKYYVTITDDNGCDYVDSVEVGSPDAISVVTSFTDPSCGADNGEITIVASGGASANYTYLWDDPSAQTSDVATGLGAGTFNVTVTDDSPDACRGTFTIALSNDDGPELDLSSLTTPTCNGDADAAIDLVATGDDTPFSFAWSTGASTEDISGLTAGSYSVSVTDQLGCLTIGDTVIATTPEVTVSFDITEATCLLANGEVTAIGDGGNGGFSYQWDDAAGSSTSDNVTGLVAGSYALTVTDALGCRETALAAVSNLDAPVIDNVDLQHVTCFGLSNGSIAISASGNAQPFSYAWTPGGETSTSIDDQEAGDYAVAITDTNGCVTVRDITIESPDAISVTEDQVQPTCGDANGSVTVHAAGGTGELTFAWNGGLGSDSVITGLNSGLYTVTITDEAGCSEIYASTLSVEDAPDIALTDSVAPLCNGDQTGQLAVSVTGTEGPYNLEWVPTGDTTSTITELAAGTYLLEVTDINGCQSFETYSLGEPDALSVTLDTTSAVCGECNGEVSAVVAGGTGTIDYAWNNGSNTETITGLCAGVYALEVTDDNGCDLEATTSISNIGGPTAEDISTTDASCFGYADGAATVTALGGTAPYDYLWIATNATTSSVTGLTAGSHFVEMADANGCIRVAEISIDEPAGLSDSTVTVKPTCNGNNGSLNVFIDGGSGAYFYSWSNGSNASSISGLSAGVYELTVTDANGCAQDYTHQLDDQGAPALTVTTSSTSCFGDADGAALASATGGTPNGAGLPYLYQWEDADGTSIGINDSNLTDVSAGDYSLFVSDALGCTSVAIFEVEQPDLLTVGIPTSSDVLCHGECTGTIQLTTFGGTAPYGFVWSDSQNSSLATGLCADGYAVTVTDDNGCTATGGEYTIDQPTPLNVNIDNLTDATCPSSTDGSIEITASGGVATYSYSWLSQTGGASSIAEDPTSLLPGTYFLSVTDANACVFRDTVPVDTLIIIEAIAMTDSIVCEGSDIVTLLGSANSADLVTYQWFSEIGVSLGSSQNVDVVPDFGENMYILAATTDVCTDYDTTIITVEALPFIDVGEDEEILTGIDLTLGGDPAGPDDATFAWSPATGLSDTTVANPTFVTDQTITYTLRVTSPTGCVSIDSVLIDILPEIEFNNGFSPNADGKNDIWDIEAIESFPEVTVEIYNRWGQLLWESDPGYTTPWDGTYNGKLLPMGTYYYVINLNHEDFPDPITGPVTIVK